MPQFLEDPRVLTKEQLRSQLLAHSVELPGGNPTKDVFVQLYLNKLTAQNQERLPAAAPDAFSSDEEAPPVAPSRSRSSGKKTPRKSEKLRLEEVEVTSLTDEGLRDELQKYGVSVGPIKTNISIQPKQILKLNIENPIHQINLPLSIIQWYSPIHTCVSISQYFTSLTHECPFNEELNKKSIVK
uniref:LEM-like domain-containing protein n=1 Tax=Cyprinodon variegatus TaxID=28743 RepID=A0A3Q2EHQ6_CYPVA